MESRLYVVFQGYIDAFPLFSLNLECKPNLQG